LEGLGRSSDNSSVASIPTKMISYQQCSALRFVLPTSRCPFKINKS
jgi:carbohydrate-binding DOMON domain-containing protein